MREHFRYLIPLLLFVSNMHSGEIAGIFPFVPDMAVHYRYACTDVLGEYAAHKSDLRNVCTCFQLNG